MSLNRTLGGSFERRVFFRRYMSAFSSDQSVVRSRMFGMRNDAGFCRFRASHRTASRGRNRAWLICSRRGGGADDARE